MKNKNSIHQFDTYNKAQESLLNKNHYFTLRELNIIKDKGTNYDFFQIYYDYRNKRFGLQILSTYMDNPIVMRDYVREINDRIKLIEELNALRDEDEE